MNALTAHQRSRAARADEGQTLAVTGGAGLLASYVIADRKDREGSACSLTRNPRTRGSCAASAPTSCSRVGTGWSRQSARGCSRRRGRRVRHGAAHAQRVPRHSRGRRRSSSSGAGTATTSSRASMSTTSGRTVRRPHRLAVRRRARSPSGGVLALRGRRDLSARAGGRRTAAHGGRRPPRPRRDRVHRGRERLTAHGTKSSSGTTATSRKSGSSRAASPGTISSSAASSSSNELTRRAGQPNERASPERSMSGNRGQTDAAAVELGEAIHHRVAAVGEDHEHRARPRSAPRSRAPGSRRARSRRRRSRAPDAPAGPCGPRSPPGSQTRARPSRGSGTRAGRAPRSARAARACWTAPPRTRSRREAGAARAQRRRART